MLGVKRERQNGWRAMFLLVPKGSMISHFGKVLVCILPLTIITRGILNHQNLSKLPQSSYADQTSHVAYVVEEDLPSRLVRDGHIAGATLDVFQQQGPSTG